METPRRGDVLDGRIVALQVLSGDLVDAGVVEDGVERGPQSADVVRPRVHEDVEVLGHSGVPLQVDGDPTDDLVGDAVLGQRPEQGEDEVGVHGGIIPPAPPAAVAPR